MTSALWSKAKLSLAANAIALALVFAPMTQGSDVPPGYMDGRADAKYGAYKTPVEESARTYQERLERLEKQSYGLSKLIEADPVLQSEKVLELEAEVLRLHLDISHAPEMSDFTRMGLLFGTVRVYEDIRHHGERLYENMIRFIDARLPGPNGRQIRVESQDSLPLYRANYRSETELTPEERQAAYEKLLAEFKAKGGSLNEIKKLTPKLLRSFTPLTRVEYVWLSNGDIKVTEGKAGHVLLAGGKDVRSAGQIILLKNASQEFTLAVVSNASGNYKPDLFSAKVFAQSLQKALRLNPEFVIVTKGEPLSSQGIKVYLKGQGTPPEEIAARAKTAEKAARSLLEESFSSRRFSQLRCGAVFTSTF